MVSDMVGVLNMLFDFTKLGKPEMLDHAGDIDFQNFLKLHKQQTTTGAKKNE